LKNQKKYAEAERVFHQGMDLYPEAMGFLQDLGACLLQQARYAEAEGIFLKGLERDPQYRPILDGMVRLKIEVRDYETAKRYAEKHKEAHAQYRKYGMIQLAQINLLQKNYPAAEKHLRETVTFDSTYAPAYQLLAYLSAAQEHYNDARRYAEKSLKLESSFASQSLLAWVLIVGGLDVAQGIAFAQKAFESKPEDYSHTAKVYSYLAIPEHTLGLAYLKKGEHEKAVQYLEQAAFAPERQNIRDDLQAAKQKLQEMAKK
jgi:Tfp pilus assembly protein PilF